MAKTAQELATAVLENLTQLEAGQDPSSEDSEFIIRRWKTINENLRVLKISSWNYNSIPDQAFEPLADYVKEVLWQKYKGDRQGDSEFVRAALNSVRAAIARRYMGNVVKAEYF